MKPNFKSPDWSEYRGYRYECDANNRICVFDSSTCYLGAFDTTQEADDFVDKIESLARTRTEKP